MNILSALRHSSRIFLGLVALVCITGLLTGCASSRTIVNALDEKEANEILVFLSSRNIKATKTQSLEGGGGGGSKLVLWDIKVPEEQATEAMALLNQSGLPRRKSQSLLGIFTGGGLVPSELQERIRYEAGLAEQIASTIRKIDGVLDAEVHISFPEEDPLNPGKRKGNITASVYIKHSGVLDDPNSHLTTKIKRLVAASVTGLDYDNVTVIADRARYGGITSGGETSIGEEPKPLVNIWSIVLAKDSVSRFQILFFSILLVLFLLILMLIWLAWKFHTLLHKAGGFKALFHLHPLDIEEPAKTEEEKKGEGAAAPASPAEPSNQTDKDVDVT